MISINYRNPLPIYEQVKEEFIKLILTGAISQGEQLPSVRELAVELAINPNTIQRAYRELESDGYINTVSGKGCFVAAPKEVKADVEELTLRFRRNAAKLIWSGMSCEELKNEIDKIYGEVAHND